jgi:hypothetical protein
MLAERQTLAQLDKLARKRGLNPGHIQGGSFPVGVTGPKGGVSTAEIGSPHYGFMVELKKSPKADRWSQTEAHLVSVDNSFNFPRGGVYLKIYGENYKAGAGVYRRAMAGTKGRKPTGTKGPKLK